MSMPVLPDAAQAPPGPFPLSPHSFGWMSSSAPMEYDSGAPPAKRGDAMDDVSDPAAANAAQPAAAAAAVAAADENVNMSAAPAPDPIVSLQEDSNQVKADVTRRVSDRLRQVRETVAQLMNEAAINKLKAEVEAAKKASAAPADRKTSVNAVVKSWSPDERDAKYLAASGMLLGIINGNQTQDPSLDESARRVTFPQLFPEKGGSLMEICRLIYGDSLAESIQRTFSGNKDIRDFFEVGRPQTQCTNVLEGLKGPIHTHCWICGTLLLDAPVQRDCEHRLNVLLALVFVGLYDPILYGVLHRGGLAKDYIELLRHEYAWAHVRCNRLKREIPVLDAEVAGKVVVVRQHKRIRDMLKIIADPDKGDYKERPSQSELVKKVATEALWSGLFKDTEPTGPVPGQTIEGREAAVHASLQPLVDKLNSVQISPRRLCARVTRTFLVRAIELAPDLTTDSIYKSLPKDLRTLLNPTGGKQRGGERTDYDRLGDLVLSVVKLVMLYHRAPQVIVNPVTYEADSLIALANLDDAILAYDDETMRISEGILNELSEVVDTLPRTRWIEFIIVRTLESVNPPPAANAAAAPVPFPISAAAAAAASVPSSGPQSPISVAARSTSVTSPPPGVPKDDSGPMNLLSPKQSLQVSSARDLLTFPNSWSHGSPRSVGSDMDGKGRGFAFGPRPSWF